MTYGIQTYGMQTYRHTLECNRISVAVALIIRPCPNDAKRLPPVSASDTHSRQRQGC